MAEAEPIELLRHLTIGVARTGHLIALKVLSRDDVKRPQDLIDLRALLRVASPDELTRARDSLALIAVRGYQESATATLNGATGSAATSVTVAK